VRKTDNQGQKAARFAAAAANIARGFATGGIYGAATGAVKSFMPEVAKAVVILIIVVLCLPLLIFASVPHILFGYESAGSGDIIAITERAAAIDKAYLSLADYDKERTDAFVAEIQAMYTDENGALFDETETVTDFGNTNIYWLIALTSVRYRQDLFAIDENAVKAMAAERITHFTEIFSKTEGEGENAVTVRTLKVNVGDMTPEDLMQKLAFTEEEKNWAGMLYGTLAESQYTEIGDSDGAGYYGTDYGDIVFSDASVDVVYYNQTDARWGHLAYGKTGTIAASGCGPTSLAIAVASLADTSVTPKDTAAWSMANGYRCEGSGSYHSLIPAGAAHYGLAVESLGKDAKKLAQALKDGKLVIAIMSKGHFTSGGHFIVLRGITSEGNILVADPASVKRSNEEWKLSLILNEANRNAAAGGPFWAISHP
jgi:hypothetical protein